MKSKKIRQVGIRCFFFNWLLVTGDENVKGNKFWIFLVKSFISISVLRVVLFTCNPYLDSWLFITLLSRITFYPNITTVLNILLTKPVSILWRQSGQLVPCAEPRPTGAQPRELSSSLLWCFCMLLETLRLTLK